MATRFKPSRAGMTEILTSPATQALIQSHVERTIAVARSMHAAQGYEGNTIVGSGSKPRAHGMVWTADLHAKRSNAKHNTLIKALGGGE